MFWDMISAVMYIDTDISGTLSEVDNIEMDLRKLIVVIRMI
jgi:hypothetical protein